MEGIAFYRRIVAESANPWGFSDYLDDAAEEIVRQKPKPSQRE